MIEKKLVILLVEDNPGDVVLTEEAFEMAGIDVEIHVASDGEEATDFLFKKGKFEDTPNPDFVLLDINLPKKDGHQVLAELRDNPKTAHIPVIMLSSSSALVDINKSYVRQANSYLTKPTELDEYANLVQAVQMFYGSHGGFSHIDQA